LAYVTGMEIKAAARMAPANLERYMIASVND
jgi:hypothetical protein